MHRRLFDLRTLLRAAGPLALVAGFACSAEPLEGGGVDAGGLDPGGSGGGGGSDAGADAPQPTSSVRIATAQIDQAVTVKVNGGGDLWPSCWSDDGELYVAWGNGRGFAPASENPPDIGVGRISGAPGEAMSGENLAVRGAVGQVWSGAGFDRKPTGMVCVNGELYLAVQDRAGDANAAPAATIARSTDGGLTWEWDRAAPMFSGGVFTTIFFADFGQDGEHAIDEYVYAYGLDGNWRDSLDDTVTDPTALYLARVPATEIQIRASWEFFAGMDRGEPTWSSDLARREPVLKDSRRVYADTVYNFGDSNPTGLTVLSQGGVVYVAPLETYLYSSWSEYTFELYQAPAPWGPWTLLSSQDFGGYGSWDELKHGGYATTIPSKFISDDGKTLHLQANVRQEAVSHYTFALRQLRLEPHRDVGPQNQPGEAIPTTGPEAVTIAAAFKNGRTAVPGNGRVGDDHESSWTGGRRAEDFWGYVWPQPYNLDQLVYTTGLMFDDGGWFDTLEVQVRRDGIWEPVKDLQITPPYPLGEPAGERKSYTLRFSSTAADGVRIVGKPGGRAAFTSIAELAVGFVGQAR